MKNITGDKHYEKLVDAYVARHTVGFAHDTPDGSVAGGSGVLVRIGKIGGILTCAHVISDILAHADRSPSGNVGIVANGPSGARLQAIKMRLSEFKGLARIVLRGRTGTEKDLELGPDLGFIQLPESTMASLEAIGSALNLRGQKASHRQPAPPQATEALTLAVGNWAELVEVTEDAPNHLVVSFATAIVSGDACADEAHDGYDRFRFSPHPVPSLPRSYEGLSGGGVWVLGLGHDTDGAVSVVDRRLVGIAYYQTAADELGHRQIMLHGPSSIYDHLLPKLEGLEGAVDKT